VTEKRLITQVSFRLSDTPNALRLVTEFADGGYVNLAPTQIDINDDEKDKSPVGGKKQIKHIRLICTQNGGGKDGISVGLDRCVIFTPQKAKLVDDDGKLIKWLAWKAVLDAIKGRKVKIADAGSGDTLVLDETQAEIF
jgi:hypothetical protein